MKKAPDAFRTIGEVADLLLTPAHVLRFWESKFYQIKPVKRAGGRRYYRPDDVALIAGIRHLLQDRGMTIRGVQKLLQEEGVRHVASLAPPLPSTAETDEETAASARAAPEATPPQTPAEMQTRRPIPGETDPAPTLAPNTPVASPALDQPANTPPMRGPSAPDMPLTAPPRPTAPSPPPPVVPPPLSPAPPGAAIDRSPAGQRAQPPAADASAAARRSEREGGGAPAAPPDPAPAASPGPASATPWPRSAPQSEPQTIGQAPPAPDATLEHVAPAVPRPAQILRAMPRGSLGARRERLAILAGRIERLLDRMSEASGSGRW